MSGVDAIPAPLAGPRRRDAAATRQALLEAARTLFGTQGFERTTIREIGERAGVDPALIARYFGGKVALYLAALAAEAPPPIATTGPLTLAQLVESSLARLDHGGVGPVARALLQPADDPAIRAEAAAVLSQRVLAPLAARLAEQEVPDPALRAEVIAATWLGLLTVRGNGSLPALAAADRGALAPLMTELLDRLLD